MLAATIRQWAAHIRCNPWSYIITCAALFVGAACGFFLPRYLGTEEQQSIIAYTVQGIEVTARGFTASMLWNSFWNNCRIATGIMLAGFLWPFAPVSLLCTGIKGFGVGIFVSSICAAYQTTGVFIGLLYLLPQSIFYVLGYITLCARSIGKQPPGFRRSSFGRRQFVKGISPSIGIILLGIVVECTISPLLLRLL